MLDLERARGRGGSVRARGGGRLRRARRRRDERRRPRARRARRRARLDFGGARRGARAVFGDGDQAGGTQARVSEAEARASNRVACRYARRASFKGGRERRERRGSRRRRAVTPPPKTRPVVGRARWSAPSRKKTKKAPRRASRRRAPAAPRRTPAGTPSWRRRRPCARSRRLSDTRAEERARRAAAGVLANVAASPECHEALADAEGFVPVPVSPGRRRRDARPGQTRLLATGAREPHGKPAAEKPAGARGRARRRRARAAARDGDNDDDAQAAETRAGGAGARQLRARHPGAGDAVCGVAGALEGLVDAAQCATLESARKHAALALYHMTRRPDLAARVVDAGGRRAMRALRGEAASEETRAGGDVPGGVGERDAMS